MKKSVEAFTTIVDTIVNEGASLNRAARSAGISVATLFRWLGSSAEHPNDWLFEWGDFGIAPLHVHVKNANRICDALLQGEAVRLSLNGFERTQVFQGRVQYEERLDIPPDMSADEIEVCFGQRDRYKRDEMGNMIPLKIAEAPNPQLMAAVLRALGGDQWADKRSVDVKVHSPGVTVIRPQPRLPPASSDYVDQREDDNETPLRGSVASLPAPPAMSAREPVNAVLPPQRKEPEPVEYATPGKDEKPMAVNSAPTLNEKAAAALERLLAQARDLEERRKAGKVRAATGPVNTGVNLLSSISPTKEF